MWRDPASVRAAYGESISYSIDSLVVVRAGAPTTTTSCWSCSVTTSPSTVVSGPQASHRVPVTVVAHDPAVTQRIAGWDWQEGMRPGPDAPVWPMDAFRDRVLTAFGAVRRAHGRRRPLNPAAGLTRLEGQGRRVGPGRSERRTS